MHGDAPVLKPGSAIAGFYLNLLGHAVGWPSPRGGAGRLTDALVGYLRSLGGEVRTGAPVERITSAGGRTTGVEIATGERVAAPLVIADVMPHELVRLAGEGLAGWYRSALKRYVYGLSTVKLDWALDAPIPWADEEVRAAGTVHLGGSESELLAAIAQSGERLPDAPALLLGQQSIADPTRAPAGPSHRVGVHPRAGARRGLDGRARPPRRAHRGAGRALRPRLPRPDPRASRARPGRPAGAQPQPRQR